MVDFKKIISEKIGEITNVDSKNIYEFIETPPNKEMGDYAFPCFKLAKDLKKAPPVIANELKDKLTFENNEIVKIEIAGGYLNFYVNAQMLISEVLTEVEKLKENYGSSKVGEGKNIVIDYSSPNIAKPFHIGHLRTTVIGNSIYKLYKFLGYNCIGVNHLGDWGTQFGKLIEGYKRWGEEYNIDENPIDELTKIYIRINALCKEDETVLNDCRNNFKKLEDGDEYCTNLWKKFRDLSIKEFQKVYDMLDIHFDSLNGEAFYADKMDEVVHILESTGKLVESEGARIIDLSDKNMAPCIIGKTNGSTTYATRDLAAIMYRAREYNYDKNIYVTSYEQILHFKQVFEVAKLLGLDEKYINGLVHVPFGMIQTKNGKLSTRDGNVIKLEDLLNEATSRVETIIDAKNPELENKKEIAKKIGIGAVIFNDLYNSRIKDELLDWDTMLNFNGETGPYVQYIYVRTKSVLEKAGYIPKIENVNFEKIQDEKSLEIIKLIYNFGDIIMQAAEKYEPYILARYLISLAQAFSSFYNENKIIGEEQQTQDARLYLTYATGIILKNSIIGFIIETIFGILTKGVLESRKSFIIGPFCSIYGLGAVIMILALQKFKKNNYTLFFGGFLVGSIIEYVVSLIGEAIFHVVWWDYSDMAFNINGRICVAFSMFWGILAIYLITHFNPKVDKFLEKFSYKQLKKAVIIIMIFLMIDMVITGIGLKVFFVRLVSENKVQLNIEEKYIDKYIEQYKNMPMKSLVDKIFSNKEMLKTFPNLKITNKDGNVVLIRDILSDINPYYLKVFTPKVIDKVKFAE